MATQLLRFIHTSGTWKLAWKLSSLCPKCLFADTFGVFLVIPESVPSGGHRGSLDALSWAVWFWLMPLACL